MPELCSFADMFRRATSDEVSQGQEPFEYQIRLASEAVKTRVIAAPTGTGKTAAAVLSWLWRRRVDPANTPRRLVYCLPMRALVGQTHRSVHHWLGRLGATQTVGLHILMGGELDQDWELHPEKEAILVGTQDLLLSRTLNRGYAMTRYGWPTAFGLLNNDCLWVCDEVQLMGSGVATTAQLEAFRRQLGTYGPCATWWMSATVNRAWFETVDFRACAAELPDIELDPAKDVAKSTELERRFAAKKPTAKLRELSGEKVLQLHIPGSLTLVIVNTIERARSLFTAIRDATTKHPKGRRTGGISTATEQTAVLLLHSRFRRADRQAVEERLRARQGGMILVATQTVEAGIDISAKTLITELAPWGSLVQRFGRCDRTGRDDGRIYWVDVSKAHAPPYDLSDLDDARTRLGNLGPSASIPALLALGPPRVGKRGAVLRINDLLGLFSTDPDLAGGFTDVSPFVRDVEKDMDVFVYWRDCRGRPDTGEPEPSPDELCRVPLCDLRTFLADEQAWEWNSDAERWDGRKAHEIRSGMTLLLEAPLGGYDAQLGWAAQDTGPVPVVSTGVRRERDGPTRDGRSVSTWVRLEDHLTDAREEMFGIAACLEDLGLPVAELVLAAAWHDIGKLHNRWQTAAIEAATASGYLPPGPGPWAKFPADRGKFRPGLRHEAAAALLLFQRWCGGRDGWTPLAAYLACAHHGKTRTTLRSRISVDVAGIEPGDTLPSLPGWLEEEHSLNLQPRALGAAGRWDDENGRFELETPSWIEMVDQLVGVHNGNRMQFGPFRLAFLEALVVASDTRASIRAARAVVGKEKK